MDHKVENVKRFLQDQRPQDAIAYGFAIDQAALLHAIEACTREAKGPLQWVVWCSDSAQQEELK
jgi:hypothetical protein